MKNTDMEETEVKLPVEEDNKGKNDEQVNKGPYSYY